MSSAEGATAASARPAKGQVRQVSTTRAQRLIAQRMAQSKATIPDFALRVKVDMQKLVVLREELKQSSSPDAPVPSLNDFIIKASALSLREHPHANGSFKDGEFELHERVNVGVAVAAPGVLIVATVFDADRKSAAEIAQQTRMLATKVREGTITPADVSGGTFTVSNLGMFGVHDFQAIVNPPQAAILAVGQVEQEPVAKAGVIVVRHMARLSLTCDHRILYGADAAAFLARIKQLLEEPASLVEP